MDKFEETDIQGGKRRARWNWCQNAGYPGGVLPTAQVKQLRHSQIGATESKISTILNAMKLDQKNLLYLRLQDAFGFSFCHWSAVQRFRRIELYNKSRGSAFHGRMCPERDFGIKMEWVTTHHCCSPLQRLCGCSHSLSINILRFECQITVVINAQDQWQAASI